MEEKERIESIFMRKFTYEAGDGFRMDTSPSVPKKVISFILAELSAKQSRITELEEALLIEKEMVKAGHIKIAEKCTEKHTFLIENRDLKKAFKELEEENKRLSKELELMTTRFDLRLKNI